MVVTAAGVRLDPNAPPARLRLALRPLADGRFAADPGRALHAALHRLLERFDPDLAHEIHAAPDKPFALGPLRHADDRPVERLVAGAPLTVTLGVLERLTLAGFRDALGARVGEEAALSLDWCPVALAGLELLPLATGPGRVRPPGIGYAGLLAAAPAADAIVLRFVTPTAFRRGADLVLEPAPRNVFGSYLRRWRAFAPIALPGLPADPAAADTALTAGIRLVDPDRPNLSKAPVDLGRFMQHGFVGLARYAVAGDEPFRRAVNTLAAFAACCGTGTRTAYGMGWTEPCWP